MSVLFSPLQLQYNDYIHYIEPCFKGILVQADRDNREVSAHIRRLPDASEPVLVRIVGVICVASRRPLLYIPTALAQGKAGLQVAAQTHPGQCTHEYAAWLPRRSEQRDLPSGGKLTPSGSFCVFLLCGLSRTPFPCGLHCGPFHYVSFHEAAPKRRRKSNLLC